MAFKHLLNRTGVVERQVRTSDGQGGYTTSWQEIQQARIRVRPLAANERRTGGEIQTDITHRVYAELDFLGKRGDRIRVQPFRSGAAEQVLEIDAVLEPSKAHHVEVDCIERRDDVSSY